MCSMNAYIILTISLCSTLPFSTFGADLVPVFIWESSSDGEPTVFSTSALAKVGKTEFQAILQERFQHKPIVLLFAEENLSVEDFSWRDEAGIGVYTQLENLTSSNDASSVYLPFVDGPLEVLLRSFPTNGQRWSKANVGPAGVPTLNVNVPNSNYLLVSLEDATDSDDRPSLLRRHDAFITEIYKSVQEKHKHVIGIYSARHSSWHSRSRRIRDVSEPESESAGRENNKDGKNVEERTFQNEEGKTNADNAPKDGISDEDKEGKETTEEPQSERDEKETPDFSKETPDFSKETPEFTKETPDLTKETPDFKKETFMTIPIVSGLMVTTLMLIILLLGVNAISEIKSNSRFDDPKGKALVIPNE